ncbi:hypothetical protein KR018_009777 [Drosophila ironensis]|nr:hypothetical protein KR018_009777 [Drosophila ironensis]
MEEYSPDTKDIPFPSTSICDQSPRYNPEPDDENDLCAFCLDRIQNPEQLHCSHSFCRCCLAKYKEARSWVADRCPICRRRLDWQGSRQSQDVSEEFFQGLA